MTLEGKEISETASCCVDINFYIVNVIIHEGLKMCFSKMLFPVIDIIMGWEKGIEVGNCRGKKSKTAKRSAYVLLNSSCILGFCFKAFIAVQ